MHVMCLWLEIECTARGVQWEARASKLQEEECIGFLLRGVMKQFLTQRAACLQSRIHIIRLQLRQYYRHRTQQNKWLHDSPEYKVTVRRVSVLR